MNFRDKDNIITILSVVFFIVVWQIVAKLEIIRPIFIGMPSEILREAYTSFSTGYIYPFLLNSLKALAIGFFCAILFGVVLGLIFGSYPKVYRIVKPFIYSISVTPMVAIMPLVIIWLGIGLNSKALIITLMSIVPILITTIENTRSVDEGLLKMAKTFQANSLFTITRVKFFYILPMVFSSLKIASGRAVTGLVVAEVFGLGKGLGYLTSFYGGTLQTDSLMAIIFVIIMLNLVLVNTIERIENKIVFWKNS